MVIRSPITNAIAWALAEICSTPGDTVIMRGRCSKDGIHLGFGECSGLVLSADPI